LLRCNNYFYISFFQAILALFLPTMYLVAIAWIYVALMMAVAEATNSNGTVLGAIVTFVMYGLVPVSIVMYLLASPARNRARKARERAEWVAQQNAMALADATAGDALVQPDASSHAPGAAQADGVTPVRKEL
jgi:membrane protein implicated in regulation of membrane protease activity